MGVNALQAGDTEAGVALILEAIDEGNKLGMRPDVAHCHAILGGFSNQIAEITLESETTPESDNSKAQIAFLKNQMTIAESMYADMGMIT